MKNVVAEMKKAVQRGFDGLGNLAFRPEDQERAKNPFYRVTREYQMALRLELETLEIRRADLTALTQNRQDQRLTDKELELYMLLTQRIEWLSIAHHNLDKFYTGDAQAREVKSTGFSPAGRA